VLKRCTATEVCWKRKLACHLTSALKNPPANVI